MTDTVANLRRKIATATDLQSVVRTMKAIAASSIGQYESAVRALDDYNKTVELSLLAYFRQARVPADDQPVQKNDSGAVVAVVFGSDQGLVGRFNEAMLEFAVKTINTFPARPHIWSVGERIQSRLSDARFAPARNFILPVSIDTVTRLVGQILTGVEALREKGGVKEVYVFHNRPLPGVVFKPRFQRLLPLDQTWQHNLAREKWPTGNLPEVMNPGPQTLLAFVREYIFVSLFRACAESLASENASRLSAMQRAERNIDELQEDLQRSFHRLRQSGIDEELFDVIAGFEALAGVAKNEFHEATRTHPKSASPP